MAMEGYRYRIMHQADGYYWVMRRGFNFRLEYQGTWQECVDYLKRLGW